jgi:DNA invertase Pin-like site-specific DNA recombinase
MQIHLYAALAEKERRHKSQSARAALAARDERGTKLGNLQKRPPCENSHRRYSSLLRKQIAPATKRRPSIENRLRSPNRIPNVKLKFGR